MTIKQSNATGNNINVERIEGNLIIGALTEAAQLAPKASGDCITDTQAKNINAIADAYSLLLLELCVIDKPVGPLLKHLAFKAAGVKEVRKIPASKYALALRAMLDHVHKTSKPD